MPDGSGKPLTLENLIALNDELVALVGAGVPLDRGLRDLASDGNAPLNSIATDLAARLESGDSLAEAIDRESGRFPGHYAATIEAGVRSGRLTAALEALSTHSWELLDLRRRIGNALVYPLVIILLAYSLFVIFVAESIQRIHDTHVMFRIPVGWGLDALHKAVDSIGVWVWIPPALLVLLVIWWVLSNRAQLMDFTGLAHPVGWIPGIRRIGKNFRCAGFADLLATLVEQGVPLDESIRLAGEASGDRSMRDGANTLVVARQQAQASSSSSASTGGLPPFLTWVMRNGEHQGHLERSLRRAAEIYRRRASNQIQWFRIGFPLIVGMGVGGFVTLLYTVTMFFPFTEMLSSLAVE